MMLRFGKTKVAKEGLYDAKNVLKVWDIYVDDIIISKLVETKDIFNWVFKRNYKTISFDVVWNEWIC